MTKKMIIRLFVCFIFIALGNNILAVPAVPWQVEKKQPDGSIISVYLRGDEKVHWMESEDGYTLMYDAEGYIVYADQDVNKNMIPSSKKFSKTSSAPNGVAKGLSYSPEQLKALHRIWKITNNDAPKQAGVTVGSRKALCVMMEFPDKPFIKEKEEFEILFNQVGLYNSTTKGSVRDFYRENSYGQLDLTVTVAGPYTTEYNLDYYVSQKENEGYKIFAKEAAEKAFADNIDFTEFADNGVLETFHILFAGYGDEAIDNGKQIWAHKWTLDKPITLGGVQIYDYSCSPELRGPSGSNTTNIGVICHEMCHVFGAPDFYDADGNDSDGYFQGTGQWDLMASGSWNDSGRQPAHINMYQKIQFGWVAPVVLSQPQAITGMTNSAMNPIAYRYDTSTQGEYFILENRQKVGFDQSVPGTGLLIYHVSITNTDIRSNTVNTGHPQKVYPVCASLNTNPTGTPQSYGGSGSNSNICPINSQGCPFPGTSGKTSFTDYTIPSATSWRGDNTLKPLTEIKEQNSLISFRFSMPDAEPVTNFQTSIQNQNNVQLTWNKPSDDVIGYNVYRNNLLLIKLIGKDNTSYTHTKVSAGNHNYCVTALYNNKESAPVCKEVKISNSSIDGSALTVKNLEARNINSNKDIELIWKSPYVSDWKTHAGELDAIIYYGDAVTQFTSIVRYTTEDLRNFQGSKLTKVRFYVYNTNCKHTIQVWTKDPGLESVPGTPIVNQSVNTPTAGIVDISLDKPVALESNKELWIGIKYEMNPMSHVAGIDAGPMVPERNFVFIDNKWYYIDEEDDFNWFVSGYLQFDSNFLSAPADDWLRSTTATATDYVVYRDNVKIATTKQARYVDPQPAYGHHIYCVSIAFDDGKESESVCVEAISTNNTAIEQLNSEVGEFIVYPNPVNRGEDLIIHCDPNTVSTLSLYNISGQLIQQERITESVFYKKMDFEPGIYLLQINNVSKTFTRRIIIK